MTSPSAIPQCDPRASYGELRERIDHAVLGVLEKGRYILGAEVEQFEAEFARYIGTRFACGVGNGTDAIELALRAAGIGSGDAVITVSHTAVATVVAIRSVGAIPFFVDVEAHTGLMDLTSVRTLLGLARAGKLCVPVERIKAIIPVHLYGRAVDMAQLIALADEAALVVVEDCAQSHGASSGARRTGTFGLLGAFSFYPTKNLGAFGDGGAVVCSDPELAARVKLLREYGWRDRYVSAIEGRNTRLDELQAAILRVKLSTLERDNQKRCDIADTYRSSIDHRLVDLPAPANEGGHVYHQFVIRCNARDALKQYLAGQGIGSLIHYPVPVHLQPAYQNRGYAAMVLSNTERLAGSILSLPMFPQLSQADTLRVATAINAWPGP